MNVLIILGVLFIALIVIIPMIEKSNMRMSDESASKIQRWILPLILIALLLSGLMYGFS
ncbi:hypothetical protein [Glaciecola petra]|uniref:Cardiolipin synthase N-terminal domain-containing protein n=1 Tax=Glaciecola petra TaxID=3075602 RepID=A0ABU2ZNJ8_9ALTE|nr:hypothetical protein [Aestuariibacter sp. P117]MDT0593991.1 hypothetical protein [Aestuariibacter sp. P117]